MALTQALLRIALLALGGAPSMAGAQGPSPLRTLQCHNDYSSRITCRWAAARDAQRMLNLTLHGRLDENPPRPVPCELSNDTSWLDGPCPGCVAQRCVIPSQSFYVGRTDYFFFRSDQALSAQISVPLAEHVQPPAPQDLRVSPAGDQALLSWTLAPAAARSRWLAGLEFEVAVRRPQDPWEDAVTVQAAAPRALLGPQLLPPGTAYLARVRARLGPGSRLRGLPGRWSPELRWDAPPPPPGDARPRGLQCAFDGVDALSCSWEVRAEVAGAVAFALFYTSSPDGQEEECRPVEQDAAGGAYVQLRCRIPVAEPASRSRFRVSVRPRADERLIRSAENIQMAPPTVSVTRTSDGYTLRWAVEKLPYGHIGYSLQVHYRPDAASWANPQVTNLEPPQHAESLTLKHLQFSTRYRARARVKPAFSSYTGIWSEWSQECVWDTEWALPPWVLPLVLVLVTLASLLALRHAATYCYRRNQEWEQKIPNPGKSLLFQNGGLGLRLPDSGRPPLWGPWGGLVVEPQGAAPPDTGPGEVSPLTTEDPGGACGSPRQPDPRPASPERPVEPPPSPAPCPVAPGGGPQTPAASFDFDGPYLGPPLSRSLPDVGGAPPAPPPGLRPGPRPPGSLEYMRLPPGGRGQLVPLARLQAAARSPGADGRPWPGPGGGPPLPPDVRPAPSAPGPGAQARPPGCGQQLRAVRGRGPGLRLCLRWGPGAGPALGGAARPSGPASGPPR